ncbi:hypothetical protein HPP92_011697 [Vanilla planifolia]|uniref:Anaphase-promoting complex subunit 1 N-terminal domain-containing protein n=1 Tax=Vanilla planifolia TaxID=51239 RepID=A0A835R4N6_VANPL|nr:hypothetical protein HPP92_011697 [Vanilla planifolia]
MSIGVRQPKLLRVHFGLTVEARDGKLAEDVPDKYDASYLVEVTRERDELFPLELDFSSHVSPSDRGEQELFIRGNRIIWSKGSEVQKRYSSTNNVVMACWCRMDAIPDALLCVLEISNLSIYYVSDGCRSSTISNSAIYARDIARAPKEHRYHYPTVTYVEERGKLTVMKDYEERTIWTSDVIPLVTTYHEDKLQHSVWLIEASDNSITTSSSNHDQIPSEFNMQKFSFRRIWQGKCSQFAASKVFLATDTDGVQLYVLSAARKKLLAVRLQIDEGGDGMPIDVRPLMIWTISAISAVPITVTRPRSKIGLLPFTDLIVLDCENSLLLYTGKRCLCRYLLPVGVEKVLIPCDDSPSDVLCMSAGLKITGVDNAVEGRINVAASTGQVLLNIRAKQLAITSWDFLVTSRFHSSYVKQAPYCSISLITGLNALHCHGTTVQVVDQRHQGEPYYTEVLMEILDSLHSLYENLKLNNLRKK